MVRFVTRRRLPLLGGLLLLAVLLNGVGGLFALHLATSHAASSVARLERVSQALHDAREAQVHFKRQVQEWKNVLLRGHDTDDRAAYEGQFRREADLVAAALRRLASGGFAAREAEALSAEHARVMTVYEEGLRRFESGRLAASFEVDRSVRGVDRELTDKIDAYAEAMQAAADTQRAGIVAGIAERYAALERWAMGGLVVAVLLLGLLLVAIRRSD